MGIMKRRLFLLIAAAILALGGATSCTTMYDSAGRPVEVITPEGAALAAVAAGVVGYVMADDGHDRRHYRRYDRHRRGHCYCGRVYYRCAGHCH